MPIFLQVLVEGEEEYLPLVVVGYLPLEEVEEYRPRVVVVVGHLPLEEVEGEEVCLPLVEEEEHCRLVLAKVLTASRLVEKVPAAPN